jgi:hypothetical protein
MDKFPVQPLAEFWIGLLRLFVFATLTKTTSATMGTAAVTNNKAMKSDNMAILS